MTPVKVPPAQAQFGEVWLAIQVGFGCHQADQRPLFGGQVLPGARPAEEAMEELEQQMEQLNAMIDEEAEISEEIGAITTKLQFNNLTQEANNQIAAITVAYGQLQDIVENGYDYYKDNQAPLAEFARNCILPLNSMETAAEAFHQSLVVHPPRLAQLRPAAGSRHRPGRTERPLFGQRLLHHGRVDQRGERRHRVRPCFSTFDRALDGGSCQSGMRDPQLEHYFAEGTVRPGFHSFAASRTPGSTMPTSP